MMLDGRVGQLMWTGPLRLVADATDKSLPALQNAAFHSRFPGTSPHLAAKWPPPT